jgi:hypothetical protein
VFFVALAPKETKNTSNNKQSGSIYMLLSSTNAPVIVTEPSGVNLIVFETGFSSTCLIRIWSIMISMEVSTVLNGVVCRRGFCTNIQNFVNKKTQASCLVVELECTFGDTRQIENVCNKAKQLKGPWPWRF